MKSTNDGGFTVVEVLIAIIILTVALVSMAELMAITLRMQMLGRNQTAAIRLAQDKIDELMTQNFNNAPTVAIGGSLTTNVANHFDQPVDSDGANLPYSRRWTVAAGPTDLNVTANAVRLLTVRITPILSDRRSSTPVDVTTLIRCWPCTNP